ncbi:hypothetical protein [Streptomyces virginiae]|uniref:hypothetical protein n=1 Tax=Streptomyces virginiae TaxID=1961 RepID=UPI0018FFF893
MTFGHYIYAGRQGHQGGVVPLGPHRDDLTVGAVDLAAPDHRPCLEGGVHLGERAEGPAGQDMIADYVDLTLDPSLALGPVGGQYVDVEAE